MDLVPKISNDTYNGLLLESTDCDGNVTLSILGTIGHDLTTQMAVLKNTDELDSLFNKDLYDTNSAKFHSLKNLAQFFPVRRELSTFVTQCRGFLPDFRVLVKYVQKFNLTTAEPNKCLLPKGDEIIQKYTTEQNWFCTRLNIMLALDKLDNDNAIYTKKLKACVGWQTPKWRGLCYRGALHSPMEIFVMAFKYIFFFPGFISTSMDPSKIIFKEYPDWGANATAMYQNVIFEIDTSNFPNFSTIIKNHQTIFDESESLLSCYNIYRWKGLRIVNNIMIISLEVLNPDLVRDIDNKEITGLHNNLPIEWMRKQGEIMRTRNISPITLKTNVERLFESYGRNTNVNFKDLLNTNFISTSVNAQPNKSCVSNFPKTGTSITGIDLTKLEQEQEANLETNKAKIKMEVEKQLGIQKPAAQPEFQKPAAQPEFQKPAAQLGIQKPAAQPEFQKPAAQPGIQKPAAQPGIQKPNEFDTIKKDELLMDLEKPKFKVTWIEKKEYLLSEKLLDVETELSPDPVDTCSHPINYETYDID